MKIIGILSVSFKGRDGKQVTGKTFYFAERIPSDRGTGYSIEKAFLTEEKIARLSFVPQVGNEVQLLYNRFGKVESLVKLHSDDFIVDDMEGMIEFDD